MLYRKQNYKKNNNYKAQLNKIESKLKESYLRTKDTVKEGLTECQQSLNCDITFKDE